MSFYTVSLLVIVCLVMFLSLYRKKIKFKYPEPPTYPGALPIIGHAYMFLGDTVSLWDRIEKISYDILKKKHDVVKFKFGPVQFYVISDPDDILTVTNTCLDKAPFYKFIKSHLGNSLFTSNVSLWKKNRKLFSPAFTQRAVTEFFDIFNSQSQRLVDQLACEVNKGKFDSYKYILDNILEISKQTMLGLKKEDLDLVNINYAYNLDRMLELIVDRYQQLWLYISFFYNRSNIKKMTDKVVDSTETTIYKVINKRRTEFLSIGQENQTNNTPECKVVLDYVLQHIDDKEDIPNDDVKHHFAIFFTASYETTTATLVFALKLIGAYPKIQDKILKEIYEIFGKSNRDVDKDDLCKLKYLEAVIKETLRLYPVAPGIGRTSRQDIKLKNYIIPGRQNIVCSIHGLHHHPMWGKDVKKFRPERWFETDVPTERLFVAFSKGRRNCIGELYAWMSMKITLVHILRRYCIFADNTKCVCKYGLILKPVSGHDISVKLQS